MKTFVKIFVIFAILFFGGLLSLAFLITDDQPVVIETDKVTPQSLADSKKLLKRINKTLKIPGANKSILIPFDALNAMFALGNEILPGLSARYNDLGEHLLISISLKLPKNPVGNYVNIAVQIGHDYSDSETNRTAIGKLSLSNATVINTASTLIKILMDETVLESGEPFIRNVSIQSRSIKILIHPELNTARIVTYFKRAGKDVASNVLPNAEVRHVQSYYDHLVTSTRYLNNSGITVSLYDLLKIVMSLAEKRSDESNAKNQNTSALIALALFTGDYNLTATLNRFLNVKLSTNETLKTKLSGRGDLKLHFIYSSMIYIMSNSGISFSIGEIKEVSDSGKGGSGFSFIDIAADKAGIKLARVATTNNSTARQLQQRISRSTGEKDIFPDVFGLIENISEERFKTLYTNRQSNEYKAILAEIDRRIEGLAIYNE